MKIDKKIIKELSDYLDEFNLTELEYTEKDTKIKVFFFAAHPHVLLHPGVTFETRASVSKIPRVTGR